MYVLCIYAYVCMYVYVCMHMCVCMYSYMHMYVWYAYVCTVCVVKVQCYVPRASTLPAVGFRFPFGSLWVPAFSLM